MKLICTLYLDVAVGAFVNDAVLLLRTRPIHTVSAAIEFGRPVIEWHLANCRELVTEHLSAAAGDNAFCLQLTIVFNYSSPAEDLSQHGDDTFHCATGIDRSDEITVSATKCLHYFPCPTSWRP